MIFFNNTNVNIQLKNCDLLEHWQLKGKLTAATNKAANDALASVCHHGGKKKLLSAFPEFEQFAPTKKWLFLPDNVVEEW